MMKNRIDQLDWTEISSQMNEHGYTLIKDVLNDSECDTLVQQYDNKELYRKTISMERYRFGLGEYKYFNYPLPAVIEQMRQTIAHCQRLDAGVKY
jgi:hypothetical protein